MINYSVYTSDKSLTNLKSPFLIASLLMVTMNYGTRCYYIEDSKNSMLIVLFFLSLVLFWRSLTLERTRISQLDGSLIVDLKGGTMVKVMIVINIIKLVSEIVFRVSDIKNLFKGDAKSKRLLTFLLNADFENQKLVNLPIVLAFNILEIILLSIVSKIQKSFTLKILEEENVLITKGYNTLETGLRFAALLLLGVESFWGNSFYILIIYFLLREQVLAAKKHERVSNSKYFSKLRYFIIMMFFFRDIFVVLCRIYIGDIVLTNQVLSTFLEEKFFRKTLFFCCCHLYMYFKELKKLVMKHITEPQTFQKVPAKSFHKSHFRRFFLNNIMHVFKVPYFGLKTSFIDLSINKVKESFESDVLIDRYIDELKRKKISHNYTIINQLVRKVALIILSIVLQNFDVIFKFLAYVSLLVVSAKNYNIHTFELYDLSVLLWSFVSFAISAKQWRVLKNLSVNIIFPCFIIGIIMTNFLESLANLKYITEYFRLTSTTAKKEIKQYLKEHLIAFIPMLVFTVFQAMRENKTLQNNKYFSKFSVEAMQEAKEGHIDFIMIAVNFVSRIVIIFSRIITLSVGIVCSLVTVNIPNTFLLITTLYFFWTSKYDKILWKYFIYYHIFFMAVIYLNQTIPSNLESFNHEFLSILGFSKQPFTCKIR